jgi:subtilisin family serine protease
MKIPTAVALLLALPAMAPSAEEGIRIPEGARLIPNSYIVVLNDEDPYRPSGLTVPIIAVDMAARYRGSVTYVYESALRGFAITMKEEAALNLAADPRVDYVEQDSVVYAIATEPDATQTGATWGIDRIDQRDLPLSGTYNYNDTAGNGVRAYIIDTGIRTAHSNFGGRASAVFDAFGGNGQDCNGHGTHVAGTVGSATWGVAKRAFLRAVRVLDCNGSGSNSGVIAGVNWVRQNHIKPAVANMSLGGGASSALDTAVNNAIGAGVTFAVAAGNSSGANACNFSPARAAAAITVGSTTRTDARSSFSNIGTCVDIFAPGSSITSTWSTSNSATNTISGTSMASPHVAGAAALYLSLHAGSSPTTIRNALVNGASVNKISNVGAGSPNRLLFRVE